MCTVAIPKHMEILFGSERSKKLNLKVETQEAHITDY